jgi:hypothetical protein
MTEKRVPVMLCVNDDYGNFGKFIEKLYIPDIITLEGGDKYKYFDISFKIGGAAFPYHHYEKHVGNINWDCAWIKADLAAMMLNILKCSGDWTIFEAEQSFWDKWEAGLLFDGKDFERVEVEV